MNAIYEFELWSLKNAVVVRRFRILIIYLLLPLYLLRASIHLSSVYCLPRAQNESIFMTIQSYNWQSKVNKGHNTANIVKGSNSNVMHGVKSSQQLKRQKFNFMPGQKSCLEHVASVPC